MSEMHLSTSLQSETIFHCKFCGMQGHLVPRFHVKIHRQVLFRPLSAVIIRTMSTWDDVLCNTKVKDLLQPGKHITSFKYNDPLTFVSNVSVRHSFDFDSLDALREQDFIGSNSEGQ